MSWRHEEIKSKEKIFWAFCQQLTCCATLPRSSFHQTQHHNGRMVAEFEKLSAWLLFFFLLASSHMYKRMHLLFGSPHLSVFISIFEARFGRWKCHQVCDVRSRDARHCWSQLEIPSVDLSVAVCIKPLSAEQSIFHSDSQRETLPVFQQQKTR